MGDLVVAGFAMKKFGGEMPLYGDIIVEPTTISEGKNMCNGSNALCLVYKVRNKYTGRLSPFVISADLGRRIYD
jgi:hypothetical protein